MKYQAIALSLLICFTLPAHGDDVADWWQAYDTNTKLVTLPDGKQLSLLCMGEGSPVVMMDAGLGYIGMITWRKVQTRVGRVTKACAYDRAGLGSSVPTAGPRDAGAEADDLAALLQAAELPTPYIVVGHSYGGMIARLYASRHTDDVAGLVLSDPASEHQDARFTQAIPAKGGEAAARIALYKDCAVDPRPADFVLKCQPAPPVDMPPTLNEQWASIHAASHVSTVEREFMAIDALSSDLLVQEKKSLGDIPFVVLNRDPTRPDRALSTEDAMAAERLWLQMHMEIMDLSSDSQLHIVPGTGHIIPNERPDALINAITDMVWKARRNR